MKFCSIRCLLIIVIITIFSCNQKKKSLLSKTRECFTESLDHSFEKHLYPFKESEYQTSDMKKYFDSAVKIDSGYNKKSNGDTVLFYKFYNDNSQFIFTLNNYSKRIYDFDVAIFQLSSELIKLNNGIEYGVDKNVFFKSIKHEYTDCDTFDIYIFESGYYIRFVFKDDILKSISKEIIDM